MVLGIHFAKDASRHSQRLRAYELNRNRQRSQPPKVAREHNHAQKIGEATGETLMNLIALAFVALAVSTQAWPQDAKGVITVKVVDQQGNPMRDAIVT